MSAEPRWLTDDEMAAWLPLVALVTLLPQALDRQLREDAGIGHVYYQILAMLSEAPDRTLRMSDLAHRTWSSRSRLSHAVDRLEENGWVQRVRCPTDKRGSFAVLTDAGYAVLADIAPTHVDSVRRHLFDQLTPDQVEALREVSEVVSTQLSTAQEE